MIRLDIGMSEEGPSLEVDGLAVALEQSVRTAPPPRTKKEAEKLELKRDWSAHLGGPKLLSDSKIAPVSGDDPAAVWQSWISSKKGFCQEYMRGRDGKGALVPLVLENYQIDALNSTAMFVFVLKGRRLGWSWISVMDGLADAHLTHSIDAYFVSRNLEEAKDKIKYAVEMWQTMPGKIRKRLAGKGVRAHLELLSKDGVTTCGLKSHPQTEPRSIQGNIYLDEFAYYLRQREILVAASNALARQGRLWVISTPRRNDDTFHELDQLFRKMGAGVELSEEETQLAEAMGDDAVRFEVPWWHSKAMVKPGLWEEAQEKAPFMEPVERLLKYGSQRLIRIFAFLGRNIDDFEVEQSCRFASDIERYFGDDVLMPILFDPVTDEAFAASVEYGESKPQLSPIEIRMRASGINSLFFENEDAFIAAARAGKIGRRFVIGVDPGDVDGWGIVVLEEVKDGVAIDRYHTRIRKSDYPNGTDVYPIVRDLLQKVGKSVPIRAVAIDITDGQGKPLAAELRRDSHFGPSRVVERTSNAKFNNDVAIDIRLRMLSQHLALPRDFGRMEEAGRSIIKDIKKVRRTMTTQGQFAIESPRDKQGHGDIYYALGVVSTVLDPISRAALPNLPDYEKAGVPARLVGGSKMVLRSAIKPRTALPVSMVPMLTMKDFSATKIKGFVDVLGLPKPKGPGQFRGRGTSRW